MSADAKVWNDDGGWYSWCGIHDGECPDKEIHLQGDNLSDVLRQIEDCMGHDMRWEIRVYPDGKTGLVGWTW